MKSSQKVRKNKSKAWKGSIAVLNANKIKKLKNNQIIIIEGMRSWEEYLF